MRRNENSTRREKKILHGSKRRLCSVEEED
jgi:hypothetical protein